MRDTQRTEEYFQQYLIAKNNEINKHLISIKGEEMESLPPHPLIVHTLLRCELEKFCILFSFGAPVTQLHVQYLEVLEVCKKVTELQYTDILTLLAIGVLLDSDPLPVIQDLLDEHQDDFLGLFTGYLKGTEEFGFEPEIDYPYILLYLNIALTESPQESEQIIYDYLTIDWFQSQEEEYWHDYLDYDGYLYFGYWSFEAMALAKIYGVDTTRLVQSDYFALL